MYTCVCGRIIMELAEGLTNRQVMIKRLFITTMASSCILDLQ